jgi:hypothetical protein
VISGVLPGAFPVHDQVADAVVFPARVPGPGTWNWKLPLLLAGFGYTNCWPFTVRTTLVNVVF